MQKIGIIGNGSFTKFIVPILGKYFSIAIYTREDIDNEKSFEGLDYLIFSIPLSGLEEVCKKIQYKIDSGTILIDVTSVKAEPLRLLKQYFLENKILGTHPIFGPQSGKNGIEGLPIVLTNVNLDESKYLEIKCFCIDALKLKVIEKTAEDHDKEMAYVQGLSHFIGRALSIINIKDYDTGTKSYKQLVQLEELLKYDSWDLYKTIQNGNVYTKDVRLELLRILNKLEEKLENDV